MLDLPSSSCMEIPLLCALAQTCRHLPPRRRPCRDYTRLWQWQSWSSQRPHVQVPSAVPKGLLGVAVPCVPGSLITDGFKPASGFGGCLSDRRQSHCCVVRRSFSLLPASFAQRSDQSCGSRLPGRQSLQLRGRSHRTGPTSTSPGHGSAAGASDPPSKGCSPDFLPCCFSCLDAGDALCCAPEDRPPCLPAP